MKGRAKAKMLSRMFQIAVAALFAVTAAATFICPPVASQVCAGGSSSNAYLDFVVTYRGFGFITNLTAVPGPGSGQITLTWTGPAYNGTNPPLTYLIAASTSGNIANTAAFNAANPLSAFSSAYTIPALVSGTTQTMVIGNLQPKQTYCFAVRGEDSGAPPAIGAWLRSVAKGYNVNNCAALGTTPMPPLGITISSQVASPILTWSPVTLFNDGTPFAIPMAPTPTELRDYRVLRATAPVLAPWVDVSGALSTATLSWTDPTGVVPAYYRVDSENLSGMSPSMIRCNPTRNLWVVGYDGLSTLEIPDAYTLALSTYYIEASSQVLQSDNRVVKNLTMTAMKGGYIPDPTLVLEGLSNLEIHYAQNASTAGAGVVPSLYTAAAASPISPANLSVYWYNGSKWLQFYGTVDALNQVMILQTKYLGPYQIRSGERVGAFAFSGANISNREITPNGDGKNDTVEFRFDNPLGSDITGKIFDVKGGFVSTMGPCPDDPVTPPTCLMWDAKSKGLVVPGGVYIYQIQGEGKNYSGTVVVIK